MYSQHKPNIFCEFKAQSWECLRKIGLKLEGWIFRGQSSADWRLKTTLERLACNLSLNIRDISRLESDIVNQFKRRARQHMDYLPSEDNLFEWLSIIQHYGGPTRLLDFTYSFYVACHFSINNNGQDSAIYCLNKPLIEEYLKKDKRTKIIESKIEINTPRYCEEALRKGLGGPLILISEPFILNERMAAQQALFAIPMVVENGFEYNLALSLSKFEKKLPVTTILQRFDKEILFNECALLKILIPGKLHRQIKLDLLRMNINEGTLFPGIDGFTRSLSDLAYKMG